MAEVLSQEEINQLLTAINTGESDASEGHSEGPLTNDEIDALLAGANVGGLKTSDEYFDEALERFEKFVTANIASEQVHAETWNFFGEIYTNGVKKDPEKANYWLVRAAEQGDAKAQCKLGTLYHTGKGMPQDYTKAVEWYGKAADQGNTKAQFQLGHLYLMGEGVPKDEAKAVEWLRKAAEQRHIGAKDINGPAAKGELV